jgi:hypothetical protein
MIITNQARYKMNVSNPYESPWKQSGGQAIPHYASVIVFMQKSGKIKAKVNDIDRVVGRSTMAKIEKNRLGPPEVSVKYDIYFDRGVDNYASWDTYVSKFKICKQQGAYYSYDYVDTNTGEVIAYKAQGWNAFCRQVLEPNPDVAKQLWEKLCEKFITTYKTSSHGLDVVHEELSGDDYEPLVVEDED